LIVARRSLGRSGLSVAPLVFGGNVFGWTVDDSTGFRLLDAFVEGGFNMIDTADVYSGWAPGNSGGESETLIGHWLKKSGRRDDVLIATKVGFPTQSGGEGLSRAHIRSSVEGSLRRLQTDRIDLYQAHADDPKTPLAETLGAFQELVDEGKVRAIGASNYTGARLTEALRVSRENGLVAYQSLQPRYNLMDREKFEGDLAPVCIEHDVGVITYSSLASGFLTGKYRSKADLAKSARGARMEGHFTERGTRILAALDELSRRHRTARASVALAWLLARPAVTAPIASATSLPQLQELIDGTSLKLDQDSIDALDRASA
jgi:aryl-alcohol dehydrogenase-like predicted oxidoreductase